MDLVLLSEKLRKDPISYTKEYMNELSALNSLVRLHSPPLKQISPIITFIVQHAQLAPERVFNVLSAALEIQDARLRHLILSSLVILRQKCLIVSYELFHMILLYGKELKSFHQACQSFLDLECYTLLIEWFKKGNERQQSFCFFFLLVLFTNRIKYSLSSEQQQEIERIIYECLFIGGKLTKLSMLVLLEQTDVPFNISLLRNGTECAKRIYHELVNCVTDRNTRIMKLSLFVRLKTYYKVKQTVTRLILKMIDFEKEDLKELMESLVLSVEQAEAMEVIQAISDEFMNEKCADDVIAYGMNLIRAIYCKLNKISKYNEANESNEFENKSNESNEFENKTNECENKTIECENEKLKESILEHVQKYRGNKTKGIYYSYKALLNAVIRNQGTDRPTTFVKRSTTREERAELRKKHSEERKREWAAEQWERKKKRKGGAKPKGNKLFNRKRKDKAMK